MEPVPLHVVATDASRGERGRVLAGWLAADGTWGVASPVVGSGPSALNHAETSAILAALQSAPSDVEAHVLTDALGSLQLIAGVLAGRTTRRTRNTLHRVTAVQLVEAAAARTAPTTLHWVRGHVGRPGPAVLHTGIDRLLYRLTRTPSVPTTLAEPSTAELVEGALHALRLQHPGGACSCGWRPPLSDDGMAGHANLTLTLPHGADAARLDAG